MISFDDKDGKRRVLTFTIGTLDKVKRATGVDLLTDNPGGALAELADDPVRFVDALSPLCGVNDMRDAMDGDAIARAVDAFVEGLTDFFRKSRPQVGRLLEATWKKHQQAQRLAGDMMAAKVDSPAAEAAIKAGIERAEAEVDQALSELQSGSSPGSSKSTRSP